MISKYRALVAVAMLALPALSACNPNSSESGAEQATVAAPSDANAVADKRKVYVETYNDLINPDIGIRYVASAYQELNIPQADPAAAINFPVFLNITIAIDRLKEGRALSAPTMAAADTAADKLIAKLQTLVSQLQVLEPYYKTRAYRDDALAKGKAAHEPLVMAMEEVRISLADLDLALREQERALNVARIDALRKAGFEGEANFIATMHAGEAFVQAVIAGDTEAADRLAPPLESAAAALAGSKPKGQDPGVNKAHFAMVAGNGTSMIGAWRDYKASKNDVDRERVIAEYNSAVSTTEFIQLPSP